uniref:HotDog ACOT-type domain-containing protein n=1 Tax=Ditylenchus dipsaci TaxID=166011 RepID=A0A915EF80_9BILA
MILAQICRKSSLASAINTAMPAFSNVKVQSRGDSASYEALPMGTTTTRNSTQHLFNRFLCPAVPFRTPRDAIHAGHVCGTAGNPLFCSTPAPQTNEYGGPIYTSTHSLQSSSSVANSVVYTSARRASTQAAVAVASPQPEEEEKRPSRFQIPVPLDASQLPDIYTVRRALQQHARDTYSGVGKMEFDPQRQHTVANGSSTSVIPLSSDKMLKQYYSTHRNKARYGMLMEQLDMFATWLGYKHNQAPEVSMDVPAHHTIGVVTALVDRIDVHQEQGPASDKDIFYHGYTSWVGKSSSEVRFDDRQIHDGESGMDGKAAPNVKLAIETEEELVRFNEAEKSKKLRTLMQKNSLSKSQPTSSEVANMHHMHMNMADPISLTLQRHRAGEGCVFMDECAYQKSFICFPVQINLHNKIFGGYLMRKAYEAAFINAQLFSKDKPRFVFGGEMVFKKAVPVGAFLMLNSQVCYTKENYMQVTVSGQVMNDKTNQLETCNSFQYSFKTDRTLPSVIPTTYADNVRYMTAKRHFETFVENKQTFDEFN